MSRRLVVSLVAAALALLVVPGVAAAAFVQFRSPSGRIGCAYFSGDGATPTVPCDVLGAGNDIAWSITRSGYKGRRIRVTDTVLDPGSKVLAYGRTRRFGSLSCTSRETGMTCRNRRGHGFTVSRERQRVF